MKVQRLTDGDDQQVKEFLRDTFSSPTHWPRWNRLVSRYHKTDFYYFGLSDGDRLLAVFPVHEVRAGMLTGLFSGQFHYIPYGGWLTATGAGGSV